MEPTVALYDFTMQTVADAQNSTANALYGATVHLDVYDSYKGNSVRVDDLEVGDDAAGSEPGTLSQENQIVRVHFASTPGDESIANRRLARLQSSAMANEWLIKAFEDRSLPDQYGAPRLCGVGIADPVRRRNSWIRPVTIRVPITTLILRLNPR